MLDELFARTSGRELGARMALVDVLSYLPGDILTKVDRMSMRVSLEARVPLLDHHLAEFALALPHSLKRRDGVTKWIFRRAIEGLVPPSVLSKPKQGFGVPIVHWLRGPLRHRISALADTASPIYRYCDRAATARILDEHQRSRRDHSTQIWRLLVLHLWLSARRL
jgi:asparagine synthase (glutamine-hydrolysing)